MKYTYRIATPEDLERIWAKDIADNPGNENWLRWRDEYIAGNREGKMKTFVVLCNDDPVGQGTLLFSPACSAIRGRTMLADGRRTTNVNALRIEKAHEGQGHISNLVRQMERYAAEQGYRRITIGVEAAETRNLAIYLHWKYDEFVLADVEDEEEVLVLYYGKDLE